MAPVGVPTLSALRADVAGTHVAYTHVAHQSADYHDTIAQLPSLLTSADAVRRKAPGRERRKALLAFVSAYVAAAKLLTKLGVTDLAMLAADRSATAALHAQSRGRVHG